MLDQRGARHRALAGQHLEEPLGEPGLQGELAEPQRRQRSGLGRFEYDGVPRGQRRRGAPGGDRHGEVPGRDDGDDAERFGERDVEAAVDGDLTAAEPLHSPGCVVEEVAYVARFEAGVADGVSRLPHLQPGEFFEVFVDGDGEAAQQPGPFAGREGRPRGLRPYGPAHGRVDVRRACGGDGRDQFLGRRVDDRELFRVVLVVQSPFLTCVRRSGSAPSR
jgi:hypothetical protein